MTIIKTRWAPVEVHVAAYEAGMLQLPVEPLERKRLGYWRNQRRNSTIATVTRSIVGGTLKGLWPYGLFLGRQYTPASLPSLQPAWLAVVVECLEHATEIQSLLPGFAVSRAYAPAPTGWQPQSIVTLAAIGEHDGFAPTVIVNAVGGRHMLDLPLNFDQRAAVGIPVAIIEFDDIFDERAERETSRRLYQYGMRRWPIFPEERIPFKPLTIPTRSRTKLTKYQQRAQCWREGRADGEQTTPPTAEPDPERKEKTPAGTTSTTNWPDTP